MLTHMSTRKTPREAVAGDKEERSLSDNGERPKPIFDTDKTPIAGDKGDPIKNNKSPSPI
jgi:hypothetical protein